MMESDFRVPILFGEDLDEFTDRRFIGLQRARSTTRY